jgi:6-phosphogluconolactonase
VIAGPLIVDPPSPALILGDRIRKVVEARGRCTVALAGGSTPRALYAAMEALPWGLLEFFFGDERAVPPGDSESNYRMAKEALFGNHPESRVHRMEADRPDLDRAAEEYSRLLPDAIDVLLLGMGPDGHTASLFPGSTALDERERKIVAVVGPKPPPRRLTITPPVIEAAHEIFVLVRGADKAAALKRAREGAWNPKEIPAQLARRGTWIVDRAALA